MNQQVLEDLKRGVILTGRLSEVHVKTLKTAPFIFFDELEKVELSYDINTDPAAAVPGVGSKVIYTLHFLNDFENGMLNERVSALVKTTKHMLWPDMSVLVLGKNGKKLVED